MTFKSIHDVLTEHAGSDKRNTDTTSTPEDNQGRTRGRESDQRVGQVVPITEWVLSGQAPPG